MATGLRIGKRAQLFMVALGLSVAAVAIVYFWQQQSKEDRSSALRAWVEQNNHVFLVPARDDIRPGDIVEVPPPSRGGPVSPMRTFLRASTLLGPGFEQILSHSPPMTVRLTDSFEGGLRAGALSSVAAAQAKSTGANRFELELTGVQTITAELSPLLAAIGARPGLPQQVRKKGNLFVVVSVLRPARFSYRFLGTGDAQVSLTLPGGKGKEQDTGGGGKFSNEMLLSSASPTVIGYALAEIDLPGGENLSARGELKPLPFQAARQLQSDDPNASLWPAGAEIRVGFMDGSDLQKQRFRAAMAMWLGHANLKVRYVEPSQGQVRVSFRGPGNTSYVGTGALRADRDRPTLTLQFTPEDAKLRPYLHEIGHALGLVHEFHNPQAQLAWDYAALDRFAESRGFSPSMFRSQVIDVSSFYPGARAFDPLSVMHYFKFPPEVFRDRRGVPGGDTISESDARYIASLYPA